MWQARWFAGCFWIALALLVASQVISLFNLIGEYFPPLPSEREVEIEILLRKLVGWMGYLGLALVPVAGAAAVEYAESWRPWYQIWFRRSLLLVLLGLCLIQASGVYAPARISGEAANPQPILEWLLQETTAYLGKGTALVGALTAFVTACTTLVKQIQKLLKVLRSSHRPRVAAKARDKLAPDFR